MKRRPLITLAGLGRLAKRLCLAVLVLIPVLLVLASLQARSREVESGPPHSSKGRLVRAGDLQVCVQEIGPPAAPAVVLIHGTGAWSEIWSETLEALGQAGFHGVAIDVPPFGYSDKPEGPQAYTRERQAARLIGVLDSLGLSRAVLVGHSVGARPTLEAALRAPERVERLVLVDPALGFAPQDAGEPHFDVSAPSGLARALFGLRPLRDSLVAVVGSHSAFTRGVFRTFVSVRAAVDERRVRMLREPLARQGTTRAYGDWLEQLALGPDTSLGSDFANFSRLRMPVLILWGGTDTVTPPWQGAALQKLIPGSELRVLEGVGHIPYIEDAAAFNAALLAFLPAPPQDPS